MPSLAPPAELLSALSGVLAELGLRWYVFGAQAVLYWGRARMTEDIDVTVELGPIDVPTLVGKLTQAGFALRDEGTPDFIARTRLVPLVFGTTAWALDVVLGGPGLEEEFARRAVPVELAPGVTVPIIAAEHLVVTKVLAGRAKDLEDIRGVLAVHGDRLDRDEIRRLLTTLEAALGVSDLLPVFEGLVS